MCQTDYSASPANKEVEIGGALLSNIKINCDASFSTQTASGGWGFIIQYDDGDVVAAGCGRIDHLLDAFQAEVVACLHGVQAVTDLGIALVVMETDASMVQQAATSDAYDLSAAGGLIVELKEIVAAYFSSFSFAYQPKECNKVAHALAARSRQQTFSSGQPNC